MKTKIVVLYSELIDHWNEQSEGSGEPLCWILPFQARNFFLKDARAFGLNSEVTKWELYDLHYMRFRQDGPVGFPISAFYVFMLPEPRCLLHVVCPATPSQL